VPKLSLANGLVYTYTKDPEPNNADAWYLTAIDFSDGHTVYKRLGGEGLGYNNNYAPISIGPDSTLYVGALGGLVLLRDHFDGYPRPKGATPLHVALVQAYEPCTAPNRTHQTTLAYGSCNPPQPSSGTLTVGTPDSNGAVANSIGSVRFDVCPVAGCAAGDVKLTGSITDVRNRSDLSDYAGELQARATVRITDRASGPLQNEPATVSDLAFAFTLPCAPNTDTTIGSSCAVQTTANALNPGAIASGKRANWELGQVEVLDGGPDGDVDTTPNTVFAREGVFVP
jgi:hypothetical protein